MGVVIAEGGRSADAPCLGQDARAAVMPAGWVQGKQRQGQGKGMGAAHLAGDFNALHGVDACLSDAGTGVALSHMDLPHALVVVRRLREYQAHLHMRRRSQKACCKSRAIPGLGPKGRPLRVQSPRVQACCSSSQTASRQGRQCSAAARRACAHAPTAQSERAGGCWGSQQCRRWRRRRWSRWTRPAGGYSRRWSPL